MTRVVFLGTPEAAVPTLEALATDHQVTLVITRPDRPTGRSRRLRQPPVKERAHALEIPVSQPETTEQLREALAGTGPLDVGVVVAYGRILPVDMIDIPDKGMLNVHFSLLPRWRGAAPVNRALMAGDKMTGVTIIKLDEGLDTGPVLTAQAIDVRPDEHAGDLTERLAHLGASLLRRSLDAYLRGEMKPVPQSDEGAIYADKLSKAERELTVDLAPQEFINRVRGLAPSPGARLAIDDEPHKILEARVSDADVEPGMWQLVEGRPVIGLQSGSVVVVSIQPPGRDAMRSEDWARGLRRSRGRIA